VVNRINAAYTIGGIQLMTETIKRVLGIPVNHVFVVTFPKFKRAVNEMGCVYMAVDRRYYHVNEPGSEQFFEINLQPGYQRMCGKEALEFVANRHEDTSLTYDTATPQQIQDSVHSFLGGTAPIPKHRLGQSLRSVHSHGAGRAPLPTLVPTEAGALAHARSAAPSLPFSLQYPRFRHPYVAAAPDTLRLYDIRDQQGRLHPSYVVVVESGPLGEYYDVQGTSWAEPPLLGNPSEAIRAGSRTYELFYEGEQIRTISWREGGGSYWIQNTLTNGLSPREMLAIAEQTVPVVIAAAARPTGNLSLRDVTLPSRPAPPTDTTTTIGDALGFGGLAALFLLAWLLLARGRELGALREQVGRAMTLEAHQRSLLAATAAPAPVSGPTERAIYRVRRPLGKRSAALGAALVAAALIAAGSYELLKGGSSAPAPSHGPVPVAVFNATSTPGAAHGIAVALRSNHVHVARIGDIQNANLGHGAYVLYPPGTERQAHALARLIPSLTPTVTPIQPQLQSTVGRHGEIVIVVD
jgi:LCP family protein required for cell wall assembly